MNLEPVVHYDELVRDETYPKRAVRCTGQNPVKPFLAKAAREWPRSSARHRDEYERRIVLKATRRLDVMRLGLAPSHAPLPNEKR